MTDNANHIVFHVEKLISLLSAGLCQAIKHDSISVFEAERLLYTPATMEILKKIGASEHVINLVHQGTELNDVLRLVPDTFFSALSKLEENSLDVLKSTSDIDWQKHSLLYTWLKTYVISLAVLEKWGTLLANTDISDVDEIDPKYGH